MARAPCRNRLGKGFNSGRFAPPGKNASTELSLRSSPQLTPDIEIHTGFLLYRSPDLSLYVISFGVCCKLGFSVPTQNVGT